MAVAWINDEELLAVHREFTTKTDKLQDQIETIERLIKFRDTNATNVSRIPGEFVRRADFERLSEAFDTLVDVTKHLANQIGEMQILLELDLLEGPSVKDVVA